MKEQGDTYPSMVLERQQGASDSQASIKPVSLGKRLKELRTEHDLTLEEVSKKTGLARSTLSKIENEQISPTFSAMQKLAAGLEIEIPQLFSAPKKKQATGRRDITLSGEGKAHPTPTYEHELLATQLSQKKMMPYKTRVRARRFEEYDDWIRHDGEEFLLVLEGEIQFFTEFYEPVTLCKGDSAYYDASMGHMLTSSSEEDALIVWITAE